MRLLHLVGSPVDEFHADLSRLYARGCLAALAADGRHESVIAHVDPDGAWRFPAALDPAARAAAPALGVDAAFARMAALAPAAVVPQLFDLPGMTVLREAVEAIGLPLVGNPGGVMAVAADKALTRAVVAAAGVRVPEGEVVARGAAPTLPAPYVVKPVDADNSQGVTYVTDPGAGAAAVRTATAFSGRALVERFVPLGREVRCGVVERGGGLVCLPLEEYGVDARTKPIRDAADKLAASGDDLRLVAKDPEHAWIVPDDDPVVPAVHAAARAAHAALGCRDYGLFDFRIDPEGRPWFLEASLYCSFSPQSVLAVMAAAAGTPVVALLDEMLARAVARGAGQARAVSAP